MRKDFNFFKAIMPPSRKADFYLDCLDGAVFIDFNLKNHNQISLYRISFDGYECCNLNGNGRTLNHIKSKKIITEIKKKDELDQKKLTPLVKEAIKINREYIWTDALIEYNLIEIYVTRH